MIACRMSRNPSMVLQARGNAQGLMQHQNFDSGMRRAAQSNYIATYTMHRSRDRCISRNSILYRLQTGKSNSYVSLKKTNGGDALMRMDAGRII